MGKYCSNCGLNISDIDKFCSSCGTKRAERDELSVVQDRFAGDDWQEGYLGHIYFGEDTQVELIEKLCSFMGVNEASKIRFLIHVARKGLVLLPLSKDRSNVAFAGLLLGSGGLAAGAIAGLSSWAEKRSAQQALGVLHSQDPLKNAILLPKEAMCVWIKEVKENTSDSWFKKVCVTKFKFSGIGIFWDKPYKLSFTWGVVGQVQDSNQEQVELYSDLTEILGIYVSQIYTEQNAPF